MESTLPPQFPPVWKASPEGLLLVGGSLSSAWLLAAYRQGIFPWPLIYEDREILAWFSPDPRTIVELDAFRIPRRVARRMRQGQYRVTINRRFEQVVAACAAPRRRQPGTWITPALAVAYVRLHRLGYAHSVEVWEEEELVGGLYGVALGGFFAGESMFHRRRDASKIALATLVERLRQRGFRLLDVQQSAPHLTAMGATEIRRPEYLRRLQEALALSVTFTENLGDASTSSYRIDLSNESEGEKRDDRHGTTA